MQHCSSCCPTGRIKCTRFGPFVAIPIACIRQNGGGGGGGNNGGGGGNN
ncbi:hypothetical protein ACOMCU_07575 [Lysinibacillus sp. UGB7]